MHLIAEVNKLINIIYFKFEIQILKLFSILSSPVTTHLVKALAHLFSKMRDTLLAMF